MSNRYTEKTSITHKEYLQLVGLRTLAEQHQHYLRDIAAAIREIVGELDEHLGHSGDCAWGEVEVDQLLSNLDITVERAAP
jgi:hypothetical protein